jgi:hypothetical protein
MKMRNSSGKKTARAAKRTARAEAINLPRMFLFLELFVEKDLAERSSK